VDTELDMKFSKMFFISKFSSFFSDLTRVYIYYNVDNKKYTRYSINQTLSQPWKSTKGKSDPWFVDLYNK